MWNGTFRGGGNESSIEYQRRKGGKLWKVQVFFIVSVGVVQFNPNLHLNTVSRSSSRLPPLPFTLPTSLLFMGLHTFLENFTLRKMPSRQFSEYSQGHFCLMLWAAEIEGAFGTQAREGQGVNGKGYSTRWAETSNIIDLGIEAISDFDSLMSWEGGALVR